jgi:spermidine synthase
MNRRRRKTRSPAAPLASGQVRRHVVNPGDREKVSADKPMIAGLSSAVLWLMVGLSGVACLIYQVLWMRQTGLLFGNTSQAAALTLAIFFGGLSLGSWHVGQLSRGLVSPFRAYALLEGGVALGGIAILVGPVVVPVVYPIVADEYGRGLALTAFRLAWTMVVVFPAAFCMGGTLPVVGQAVIRQMSTFGSSTARLYAVNTIGAATGAFAAAFLLIGFVGIRMTCLTAMTMSLAAALLAGRLSRRNWPVAMAEHSKPVSTKAKSHANVSGRVAPPRLLIFGLALLSGFIMLALEVTWTRILAQVHENSVYSFATVLIVVLVCLSLGAWFASWLARGTLESPQILVGLFVAGGIALGFMPFVFVSLTHGMRMLDTDASFVAYVLRLFMTSGLAIGPPCVVLGTVFPFLMKGEESYVEAAGASIGHLAAVNAIGAILGSLAAGFVLLEGLGMWGSIQIMATACLLVAFVIPAAGLGVMIARGGALVMLLAIFTVLSPTRLTDPANRDPMEHQRTVVETWDGSDCTVAVVRDSQNDLSITINSNYSLGSLAAYSQQIYQARIPLLAFPATQSVFFLGMGTGITAGEALSREPFRNIDRIVVSELSPNVVVASQKYFTGGTGAFDPTNGLYRDPRARVIIGDGRNQLLASRHRYSMINADLFLPYRRGTGNLYSREHFRIVRERLDPGGVFVQWLPLYQMTEREFGVIARTMLDVFPQVSLWRGNFQPGAEIAAFMGHADSSPLPACSLDVERAKRHAVEGATHRDMNALMLPINEETVLLFYAGNLTRAADLFEGYPLNTDDMPVIEFGTPRSLHQPAGVGKPHFLESRFADLVDTLQEQTPPDQDPLLARRTPASRRLPLAGSAFHRAGIAGVHGDDERLVAEWRRFLSFWTD